MIPFSPHQWAIIEQAVGIAQARGWQIYAVGGIVRDALLGNQQPPTDIDLVVAGGANGALVVARELRNQTAPWKFVEYAKFQTAELRWADFTLDLTTARTEVYPYPGANPIVTPASLAEDLYRRDFTVNALAVELLGDGQVGAVVDLFDGLGDLHRKVIRAIKVGSFAEDPRRIFRGVRFAVRLGFTLAQATQTEIQSVCASGLHDRCGGSRLRAELIYILKEGNFSKIAEICTLLQDLGAWRCVDPHWQLQPNFIQQLRRLKHWWYWFGRELDYFLLGLAVLLWQAKVDTLENLDMSILELKRIHQAQGLVADLPALQYKRVSEIYDRFSAEELGTIILAGAITGDPNVWRYLTRWRHIKPLLTGTDLVGLGYPRGKQLGQLLHSIHAATLDGIISSKEDAIVFAKGHWYADNSTQRL
ncbi:MAG: CCA tRNA nucleotidyltransferase [Pseudanabaenaceae cyanobacterium]